MIHAASNLVRPAHKVFHVEVLRLGVHNQGLKLCRSWSAHHFTEETGSYLVTQACTIEFLTILTGIRFFPFLARHWHGILSQRQDTVRNETKKKILNHTTRSKFTTIPHCNEVKNFDFLLRFFQDVAISLYFILQTQIDSMKIWKFF
jgi:hypothetical protein